MKKNYRLCDTDAKFLNKIQENMNTRKPNSATYKKRLYTMIHGTYPTNVRLF
jgi:hypothetical protein